MAVLEIRFTHISLGKCSENRSCYWREDQHLARRITFWTRSNVWKKLLVLVFTSHWHVGLHNLLPVHDSNLSRYLAPSVTLVHL